MTPAACDAVRFLKVWNASDDFVNETLNADDFTSGVNVLVLGAKGIGDDAVVSEWDSASVDLSTTSLVDELTDDFS